MLTHEDVARMALAESARKDAQIAALCAKIDEIRDVLESDKLQCRGGEVCNCGGVCVVTRLRMIVESV